MGSRARESWTSSCIDVLHERRAQATVEAAVLLPSFLILMLLALQPVCILYTRGVMESAAAETARLMITSEAESKASLKAFALRRLAAVPDVEIFHAGGPLSWDIELVGAAASGGRCQRDRFRSGATPAGARGVRGRVRKDQRPW